MRNLSSIIFWMLASERAVSCGCARGIDGEEGSDDDDDDVTGVEDGEGGKTTGDEGEECVLCGSDGGKPLLSIIVDDDGGMEEVVGSATREYAGGCEALLCLSSTAALANGFGLLCSSFDRPPGTADDGADVGIDEIEGLEDGIGEIEG